MHASIRLAEQYGFARHAEPVRTGVPWPCGALADVDALALVGPDGQIVPHQARVLSRWPDGSIRWVLIDFIASIEANAFAQWSLESGQPAESGNTVLWFESLGDGFAVDTGAASFAVAQNGKLFATAGGTDVHRLDGVRLVLTDARGQRHEAEIGQCSVESHGPIVVTAVVSGQIGAGRKRDRLRFEARLEFFTGSAAVRVAIKLHNPRAARHPGNLWDLGDAGSHCFDDLSLELVPAFGIERIDWRAAPDAPTESIGAAQFRLYQDSSGGERWDSSNHIGANGELTVAFRGWAAHGDQGRQLASGDRATPVVAAVGKAASIAVCVEQYWQNFPKALRVENGAIGIGLFPRECSAPFELQGGEQKRHTVWIEVEGAGKEPRIGECLMPLAVSLDPAWVEAAGAVAYALAVSPKPESDYAAYLDSIVDGPDAFVALREIPDEYGWRNFGDLYADHEAVGWTGPQPLISHYNNQYDFICSALRRFLSTGDVRWFELADAAARHTADIDIYHTDCDRAAYNGGLFWHSDHYRDAATASHRAYSRANGAGAAAGGGPSNEQNYTSGLLLHHYLTGDTESAAGVLSLAEWVHAMDDGSQTLLGVIDGSPNGLASRTVDDSYHKPGRGAGNSINALLDAYQLTGERRHMEKAEALIRRVIHPADDIAALTLDEPEYRWSYLVFLQVLGRYLDLKAELGETDWYFYYARDSLLHYARWILEHEVPYASVLDKVEIPTETWPAQDIRKCHVLHLAANYSTNEERDRFAGRAQFFFERCLTDLLACETARLTRPRVLIAAYGPVHEYFTAHGYRDDGRLTGLHHHAFGSPRAFVPQRARVVATLARKLKLAWRESGRLMKARLDNLVARFRNARR